MLTRFAVGTIDYGWIDIRVCERESFYLRLLYGFRPVPYVL